MRWTAAILAVTLLIFFFGVLRGEVFYFGDNLTLFYPVKQLIVQELGRGRLPLWNPYILSGTPLLSDVAMGGLSPFNLTYFFLQPAKALTVNTLLALYISALGMLVFLRAKGFSWSSSIMGALCWLTSGSLLERTSNVVVIETIAFLPWTLAMWERSRYRNKWWLTSVAWMGAILGGYLPLVLIWGGIFLVWVVYDTAKTVAVRTKLFRSLIVFGLAAMLAAVQLLPFFEFYWQSTRFGYTSGSGVQEQLSITELPRLILGEFYGAQNQGNSWGFGAPPEVGLASTDGFFGMVALLLIVLGWRRVRRIGGFWLGVAVTALMMSFGDQIILGMWWQRLPILAGLRAYQWLVPFSLAMAVLVALAAEGLRDRVVKVKPFLFWVTAALGLLTILSLQWLIESSLSKSWWQGFLPITFSLTKTQVILANWQKSFGIEWLLLLLAVGGLLVVQARPSLKRYLTIFFLILMLTERWSLGRGSVFLAKATIFNNDSLARREVAMLAGNNYRFLAWAGTEPYSDLIPLFNQLWVREPFGESRMTGNREANVAVLANKARQLPPNLSIPFQLRTVNGYAGMMFDVYRRFWESSELNKLTVGYDDQVRLSTSSVKYLLAPKEFQPSSWWHMVGQDDRLGVYENKA